jgi:hypothetical protein
VRTGHHNDLVNVLTFFETAMAHRQLTALCRSKRRSSPGSDTGYLALGGANLNSVPLRPNQ